MSSILSFSAQPSTVNGTVVFEMKNSNGVTFGNGSNVLQSQVSPGQNSTNTSLTGPPSLIVIDAYFSDELGQEKHFNVNLT